MDLNRVFRLLENTYDGTWSATNSMTSSQNLMYHWTTHGTEFGLSGLPDDLQEEQEYVNIAVVTINDTLVVNTIKRIE